MKFVSQLASIVAAIGLSGCFSASDLKPTSSGKPVQKEVKTSSFLSDKTKFSQKAYGVAASPRVTRSLKVRKGGGRRQIGKRYKIKGKWYQPKEEPGYNKVGNASWYGPNFHGRLTANGEVYDQFALSAAHPTFPLPSYARVTNLANGSSVIVRVNDRGPYHAGRIIDLSAKASKLLDYQSKGVARVRVQYIGQAPLHGLDESYLSASFKSSGSNTNSALALAQSKAGAIKKSTFDMLSTGAIAPKKSAPGQTSERRQKGPRSATANDPFAAELSAIRANKDTGTTLAKRLVGQFITDSQ